MNMQKLLQEAQKMKKNLEKDEEELRNSNYEGDSSFVHVVVNGNKEVISIKINLEDNLEKEDVEMLEDMLMVALKSAMEKADADRNQKMSKYGSSFPGLM